IIGGHDAQVGAWPWTVSLQIRQTHVCGGVLVSEKSVLTAGHCAWQWKNPYFWRAVLGAHNLWKHGKHAARRKIRSISVHPGFKTETFENDLAVFELHRAVRYSDYIQPICLPHSAPLNHTECFVSGWGRTAEKGPTSSVLKEARVEIIPYSICNGSDAYAGLLDEKMLCAGSRSGGTDTCQGDSGGPLACHHPDTNKFHLVGIASFGLGCGRPDFPGVYIRVSQYSRWI
ncbi:Transmembrane protease serine 12, partial [Colius striatus]